MLTELDPRVTAQVNLEAVLGSLPMLAATVPEAQKLLATLNRPVTLRILVRGGPSGALTFDRDGVRPGTGGSPAALLLTSCEHFNRMIAGTAQPVPVAGPTGLRFLTQVFTPLTAVLGRYLEPSEEDLRESAFAADSIRLTLRVVLAAVAVIGNTDRSGQVSAAQMPDGRIDLEVGDEPRRQILVSGHRLALVEDPVEPAQAVLRFSDLDLVGAVFSGRTSAITAVSDGRMSMRGVISMVDNLNRILDRSSHYLGK